MHLVEQLLANGVEGDHAAGPGGLGDHEGAVGLELTDREADHPRGGVRPPIARVVATADLARALEQVSAGDSGCETVPVVSGPPEFEDERGEEQRRVGDPTADHDVGAGLECFHDRTRSEVGVREECVLGKIEVGGVGADVVAHDRGHLEARDSVQTQGVDHRPAGADRVDATGVGDHLGPSGEQWTDGGRDVERKVAGVAE